MAAYAGAPQLSLRDCLDRRWTAMKTERTSWDTHVRDVFDHTRPRRTRFQQTQTNKGDRRNQGIIDNTGVIASNVLMSGMVNGMSSPAQPWFRYEPEDLALMEYGPAKEWIGQLERLVRRIFHASNTYEALPSIYEELILAGTGAGVVEDDFEDVIRTATFTWGEYALALNGRRVVDTLYREMRMTVIQCVQQFGLKNVSSTVRSLYDTSQYDHWVDVMHAIEPNMERDHAKADAERHIVQCGDISDIVIDVQCLLAMVDIGREFPCLGKRQRGIDAAHAAGDPGLAGRAHRPADAVRHVLGLFHRLVEPGGDQRRNAEEEAHPGGGHPVQPEQQSAGDGGPRA